jgi:hypothetical protein
MGAVTLDTVPPDTFHLPQTSAGLAKTAVALISRHVFSGNTTAESKQLISEGEEANVNATIGRYVAESTHSISLFNFVRLDPSAQRPRDNKELGIGLVHERSIILQQWEGLVLSREKDTFTARLFEGYRDFPPKSAEISLEEIADEQREFVVAGAMFSWTIGYRLRGATRSRFSEIYVRRLPAWTEKELKDAKAIASRLNDEAGWF